MKSILLAVACAGWTAFSGCSWESIGGGPNDEVGTSQVLAAAAFGEDSPIAVATEDAGRVHVFARNQRGEVFQKAWTGQAWSPPSEGWQPLGGAIDGGPEVVPLGDGTLALFVRQADGGVYAKSWVGGAWAPSQTGWTALGMPSEKGVVTRISVASTAPGTIHVGAVTSDGHAYVRAYSGGGRVPGQKAWTDLGGGIVGAVKLVSPALDHVLVFARKADGGLYVKAWHARSWGEWKSLGSPAGGAVAGDPAAVAFADARVRVVVPAADGGLYGKEWDGQAKDAAWIALGPAVGTPGLVAAEGDRVVIFALLRNGTIGMKSWAGGGDVSVEWALSGAPEGAVWVKRPAATRWGPHGMHVVALDSNGIVRASEWGGSGQGPAAPGWTSLGGPMGAAPLDMVPFWKSSVMYNESVVLVSQAGGLPRAKLLWSPTEILSVRDPSLGVEYRRGVDWDFDADANTLYLPKGSRAPSVDHRVLYPPAPAPGTTPKVGGGNIFHREGSVFHDWQVAVTYRHSAGGWTGPRPMVASRRLAKTLRRLGEGAPLKILLLGDSIAAGYNASGFRETLAPPFQPSWGDLFVGRLRERYASPITFANPSIAGKSTDWGKVAAKAMVARGDRPDLAIIAFGMNDGMPGFGITSAEFRRNLVEIMGILDDGGKADVEFVLVSSMVPNAMAVRFWGRQRAFREVVASIASERDDTAIVDMTTVHEHLLGRKPFVDMSGNDLNHPNDFLNRWYAQMLAALLVP